MGERKGNKDSYSSDIENEANEGQGRNNKRELSLLVISHTFKSKALTKKRVFPTFTDGHTDITIWPNVLHL